LGLFAGLVAQVNAGFTQKNLNVVHRFSIYAGGCW